MNCLKCGGVSKDDAAVCSSCGAALQSEKKSVPSSMTIEHPSRKMIEVDDTDVRRQIPKGLLAVMVGMGALLVAGVIFVGVLLLTQPSARATVGPPPSAAQTATATPEPTEVPSPTPAPSPTVSPDEDVSSLFETPSTGILPE